MQIEFRNDSVFISGYVNAVERESHILASPKGKFKEIIRAKVFERALQRANDVLLLFNHDESKKLGSLKDGNLTLIEDAIGLKASCEISDSSIVQRAKQPGFLQGWSFAFSEIKSRFERGKDGIELRFIEDLDLFEVSLLSVKPAYPATSVEVRNDNSILERRYTDDFETNINKSNDLSLYEKQINYLTLKGCIYQWA